MATRYQVLPRARAANRAARHGLRSRAAARRSIAPRLASIRARTSLEGTGIGTACAGRAESASASSAAGRAISMKRPPIRGTSPMSMSAGFPLARFPFDQRAAQPKAPSLDDQRMGGAVRQADSEASQMAAGQYPIAAASPGVRQRAPSSANCCSSRLLPTPGSPAKKTRSASSISCENLR